MPGWLAFRAPSTAKPEDLTHTQCKAKTNRNGSPTPIPQKPQSHGHLYSTSHSSVGFFQDVPRARSERLSPDSPTQGVCLGGKSRGVASSWSPERAVTLLSSS